MTVLVAGSGPAGVFAALGALESGMRVVMVDPAYEPDTAAQALKKKLSDTHWKNWSEADRSALKATQTASVSGLSHKRVFGSDFATRPLDNDRATQRKCRITRSNARGGLSNVWGRGIEPPYAGEADHWTFRDAFEQSMRAVLTRVPLSGDQDNLAKVLPLIGASFKPHRLTHASQMLLDCWQSQAQTLNADGMHFGKTRLALRTDYDGCVYCGMCFYGCAYGAMFETASIVAILQRQYPQFEYRPWLRVDRFESTADGVNVKLERVYGGNEEMRVSRLILASGAPETTAIALRSLKLPHAVMKNSDLIKIPFLRLTRGTPRDDGYHALSQLTLTINRRSLSKKAMVMHLFGKNPMIDDAVLRYIPRPLHILMRPLLDRLMIGMCFLHSDDSGSITVSDAHGTTVYTGKQRSGRLLTYIKLMAHLWRNGLKLRLLALPVPGAWSVPGSSVHYGASLDVSEQGELKAARSVYIADGAALPEIPAGSYTLSIMANAHRIGKQAAA